MHIKYPLMALLKAEPRTANQLRQDFNHVTGDLWPINIGQVAQTLTRLERDELATPCGETTGPTGRQATLYQLTPAGQKELETWWATAVGPLSTASARNERDELVLKFLIADSDPDINFLELLDAQRFNNLRLIRQLGEELRELPATRTAQRLIVEKQLLDLEAQSRLLDRIEALTPSQERQS